MNKPTKIYAEILEPSALEQFESAMSQAFAIRGALMPDAHTGYSLPIGAVVAADNYVVPAWVGYDIGCGMCALKLEGIDPDEIEIHKKEIFDEIYKRIPVGFNVNQTNTPYSVDGLTKIGEEIAETKNYQRALGSLGGGNHFLEIGISNENEVWIVIHSGSRGVGHAIATHYMKKANPEGKAKDGHWGFKATSQDGQDYIRDMNWALDFALANRKEMAYRTANLIAEILELGCYEADFSNLINRNHNHAEYNYEKDWWVHRKGATHAEEGMLGVIPGNMRDGSFIVRGKGNPDSLYSSSHGAGRVLGRKQAKRELTVEEFKETMGVIQAKIDESTLDESPFAYKDIYEVMNLQKDLVEIITQVKPIINIKG